MLKLLKGISMKPKVLVVEDDYTTAHLVQTFLESSDYDVTTASNGQKGIEVLSGLTTNPDLIISDIMMPVMDGYDFYLEVSEKDEWSRIPFFFLSAKAQPDDVRFGEMLGADDYITKPFEIEDFLKRIETKIAEYQEQEQDSDILQEKVKKLKFEDGSLVFEKRLKFLYMFYLGWDEINGPIIIDYYPKNEIHSLKLKNYSSDLFSTLKKVYDYENVFKSNKFIIRVVKDLLDAYILIENIDKTNSCISNEEKKKYMLCLFSRKFYYLETSRITQILENLSEKINKCEEWDLEDFWNNISKKLNY